MLKIENTEVLGWEHAIRGMRNPMNSWEKSDSKISTCECEQWPHSIKKSFDEVGPNDLDLMDCKNCVSALVCKDAQDSSYREKIREGEISCCDFYPRPDDSLKKAIAAVAKLDSTSGVPQSVYVAEECSELVKELMKKERRKGNNFAIIDEACDVLTTVFIMLYQYGVTEWTIQQNILAKCKRALERYEKFGEL